jgi:DNA-binding response OmpR family regulator
MISTTKKILVFDDDATFGRKIGRQAAAMHIEAIVCNTMDEFCLHALDDTYDIALIDYHLETLKGDNVARVIEEKPVVLMSMDSSIDQKKVWPNGIVGFVSKRQSARQVLNAALTLTK